MSNPKTLSEKIWEQHLVRREEGKPDLLYIDLHLVHEVTSPQAFESLRMTGRTVRRPDLTLATVDHNVPTIDRDQAEPGPALASSRSRRCARTAKSSASRCSASSTCARASCTSSGRSRA